jgi:chemotaxis protein MotB
MMRGKKQHEEDHADETWLLPYSDMLTLLLALFIVMFAMSKVDGQKFKQVSQQFNTIFSGSNGVLTGTGGGGNNAVQVADSVAEAEKQGSIAEQDKMAKIKSTLEQEVKKNGYTDQVKLDLGAEGLNISIQDIVIFNSGQAEILPKFNPVLLQISNMLKGLSNEIRVSGYTDNVPIGNKQFRNNWDLSYMRASNVMNFMVAAGHIQPDKFSIQAYGEHRPKYDNSTEDGRAKNRRVDILLVREYAVSPEAKN